MKIYLNGMDHVAAGLGAACRFTPGRSNHFMLAAALDGVPDGRKVGEMLDAIPPEILRMLSGRSRRGWDLAPYWEPGAAAAIPRDEAVALGPEAALAAFGDLPLPERRALAFRLVRLAEGGALLLWKFSHRLFDGLGAECLVQGVLTGKMADCAPFGMADAALHHWLEKMRSGRNVNRALLAMRRTAPVMRLPGRPVRDGGARYLLRSVALARVEEKAEREAGSMMLGCFVMGATARVAADFLRRRGAEPGLLVMPVSLDLRKRGAKAGKLFFNQWGMLPMAWHVPGMADRSDWVRQAKMQTAEMIAAGLPGDFAAANLLMRILPERAMARLSQRCFQGGAGSFMFSLLAQSGIPERALGCRVVNFYHAPAMPPAPAFGLFMNCHRERLNLTASWRDGALPVEAMRELLEALARELEA